MNQHEGNGRTKSGRKEQPLNALRAYLRACERQWLLDGLARHGGKGTLLAAELGVERANLGRLLRLHGLTRK